MNQMIKELQETSFYKELCFKENPKLIIFCGSELIGYKDERSDYDILCLSDGQVKQREYNEYLMWYDKKVHCIYQDYNDFFNPNIKGLDIILLTQTEVLTDDKIIYVSDNRYVEFIKQNKSELLKNGLYILYFHCQENIKKIIEQNDILDDNKTKFLYHIVYAKRRFFNEEIEENYLVTLKRIRWQVVETKYILECIKDLKELDQYINENPYDLNASCTNLKNIWERMKNE